MPLRTPLGTRPQFPSPPLSLGFCRIMGPSFNPLFDQPPSMNFQRCFWTTLVPPARPLSSLTEALQRGFPNLLISRPAGVSAPTSKLFCLRWVLFSLLVSYAPTAQLPFDYPILRVGGPSPFFSFSVAFAFLAIARLPNPFSA